MTKTPFRLLAAAALAALLPGSAAMAAPQMSDEQMQQMMQHAQKMQECMSHVDQSEMQALEQKSRKMETEIKALCAAGKRDEAQRKAMAYGKEMSHSKAIQEMKKCGDMARAMMPSMAVTASKSGGSHHVCDNLK